ncbi:TonB-dependent receptor [Mesonia aquimarina]|uniref:TonB-dependent receptor n=1 Tax=Mesonia aquimarina TaxID=1504967 RepID=UPI000EF57C0E|nr:TonB-dependent receptor [Mesonia aquimarina]
MRILTLLFLSMLASVSYSQETGALKGSLADKETDNQPLPFANVVIKGTSKGTTTDFDGLYEIKNVEPGTYTIVFSFVGYETKEIPDVVIKAGETTTLNGSLGSSAAALDAVMIKAVGRRDSESALLLKQKDAIEIKESIGAQELTKMGVSDAATATTKISGVNSSEASGDVFVRGLGDRYLYTTLNGLPIPSNDINRKNIDLGLFPTRVVESVSISKTYSPSSSADQASGHIDITSRSLAGTEEFNASTRIGVNTNAIQSGIGNNFKQTANNDDISLGFYSKSRSTENAVTEQTWNNGSTSMPVNYRYTFRGGKKIGEKFKFFITGSHRGDYEYRNGFFKEYQNNRLVQDFSDVEQFRKNVTTSALLNLDYKFNNEHSLRAMSLLINELSDRVYESGRNGEGFVFEETAVDDNLSQFIRDQNTLQTRLWVNQLIGEHELGEKNTLNWAIGYNIVDTDQPNRIRNELNFSANQEDVYLGEIGGYQNNKSYQYIDDTEYNGRISDEFKIINKEDKNLTLTAGGNYRRKDRDFKARSFGLTEPNKRTLSAPSIDNLDPILNQENIDNGTLNFVDFLPQDVYDAYLESMGGFLSANFNVNNFNFNVGARYQNDDIYVNYDVNNISDGSVNKTYDNIYPSLSIKYALNEKNNFRIAGSKTITLPELKEIAPFEYVPANGQIVAGNPDVEASTNYNLDAKWEFFPSSGELLSITGFYKQIQDPINRVQRRGSSGVFSYFNSGEKAEVYGVEFDANIGLIEENVDDNTGINLDLNANVTRMWHNQDLKEIVNESGIIANSFRYAGKTEEGLQGASDWIFNAALNFSTAWENELSANVSASYSSDKIFALGRGVQDLSLSDVYYNDAIIEKGFVTLNLVVSQELNENWTLRFTGKNLLNPTIEREQDVLPIDGDTVQTNTVQSYTRGAVLSLGVSYNL